MCVCGSEMGTKQNILSRLRSNECVLKAKTNAKNSPIWSRFQTVCDARTGLYTNYVQCVRCKSLYIHKEGAGTGTLGYHVKKCDAASRKSLRESSSAVELQSSSDSDILFSPPGPSSLPSPVPSPMPVTSPVPPALPVPHTTEFLLSSNESVSFSSPARSSDTSATQERSKLTATRPTRPKRTAAREVNRETKGKITDLCVKFAARDLRSYDVIKGEGFKDLAQGLISVGADFGNVNVKTVQCWNIPKKGLSYQPLKIIVFYRTLFFLL